VAAGSLWVHLLLHQQLLHRPLQNLQPGGGQELTLRGGERARPMITYTIIMRARLQCTID